jgi:hypothetical protein
MRALNFTNPYGAGPGERVHLPPTSGWFLFCRAGSRPGEGRTEPYSGTHAGNLSPALFETTTERVGVPLRPLEESTGVETMVLYPQLREDRRAPEEADGAA